MEPTNLREYLDTHACIGFSATPHYFPSEDYLTYYFQNDRCYSERIDDLLTVYRSMETKEIVGVKIKGARHIVETAGSFEVMVEDDDGLSLGFFFFIGALMARSEIQKRVYSELGRFKHVKIEFASIAHSPKEE